MRLLTIILAAVAATFAGSVAEAATGWTTSDVTLWRNPITESGRLTVVPAGAAVEVYRCLDFCEISYGPHHGWADARSVATPDGNFIPMFLTPSSTRSGEIALQPVYVPPQTAYLAVRSGRWCSSWRCPDQTYGSWYAGKTFYFNGRFADRPDLFAIVGR